MARGQSDDIERNASVATRSKSIVSLTAFDGMDEYTALQKFIQFYRDPRSQSSEAAANAADAKKSSPWWKFWRSGSSPKAQPGLDAGTVPDNVSLPIPMRSHWLPAVQAAFVLRSVPRRTAPTSPPTNQPPPAPHWSAR